MTATIIIGDCRDALARLPDESVHCVAICTATPARLPAGGQVMTEKLLPCPCCGGEALVDSWTVNSGAPYTVYSIYCKLCRIRTTDHCTLQEAFDEWNRRHDPVRDELVAAAEHACKIIKTNSGGIGCDCENCKIASALAKAKGGAQ